MRVLYIFYLAFNLMLSKLAVFDGGTEDCRLYLGDSERPQVVSVEVVGADNAQLTNVYGVNFLHTGVVGLFGCPVEVTASEFDGAHIIFSYDSAGLNLVPPQNLLVLWYDEQNSSYRELEANLNEALCTVSLDISQGGAYMLVDRYEWFRAWGYEAEDYAHDIYFTGDGFEERTGIDLPQFGMVLPKSVRLFNGYNGYDDDYEQTGVCIAKSQSHDDEPYFQAVYRYDENLWQSECDGWAQLIYNSDEKQKLTALDFVLENGAQAKLYRYDIDNSSRGGAVGVSLILQVKLSNNELISLSYSISDPADSALIAQCLDSLKSFEWGGALSEEAFVPAEERGADYFPQQAGVEDIALVQQEFDSALAFTMLIPDCLKPYCCKNFTEFDMGGYTEIGLAYCNGSDDIYCDFNLLSGDNVNQSWLDGDNLLHIEGESRTVTDISGKTGIPSEIYVLRFADTGKVESSHLVVYVYGVYHISDTEMVTALYSLWADNADELMPLVTQSLESFRLK